jgi:hypothetical protein
MIIKSLSRKKPTFEQLYNYMIDGAEQKHFIISKNLYNTDKEKVILQFKENSKLLPKRKNGVFLYHEIISLPEQKEIPKKKQKEILCDIANKYLEKRTNLNLAFGTIHEEKDHLHCHLMISSNELNSPQRQRLSKEEFSRIQKEIESYKLEKFPELQDKILYNKELTKNKYQKSKSKDQENQYKHRTKEQSRAEKVKEITQKAILSSFTVKDFQQSLEKYNFELYIRGQTAGIIDKNDNNNTKYRLKRLDLEPQYQNLLEFEKAREEEIEKIRGMQGKSREIERER